MSDDELTLLAINAMDEPHQYHDTLEGMSPAYVASYLRIARAIRRALTPAVEPLAPGETVTIPDAMCPPDSLSLEYGAHIKRVFVFPVIEGDTDDDDRGVIALDSAGLDVLELTCRRARAALEGE